MPPTVQEFDALVHQRITAEVPAANLRLHDALRGLVRAADRIVGDLESAVHRPRGLSWSGYRVLFCLWVEDPLQTSELARRLYTTAPNVSSVINTLERRRLVRRRRDGSDRRHVAISLTPLGRSTIRDAFTDGHSREQQWMAEIDDADLDVLTRVTEQLVSRRKPPRPESS